MHVFNSAEGEISFDPEDGINDMENEGSRMKDEIYDLNGRRVNLPTKGIYINRGKKIIVR